MDPNKLRLFVSLATSRHFGRAAAHCHVSPSTVSRNLKQLEDELGCALMLRDNRSVSLTLEGERFLRFARETLQHWETFQDSLQGSMGELRGQLSIYCSVTASYSFLYDILTRFRVEQPGIGIKLHTGDPAQAIERILGGQEDIAIAARPAKLPKGLGFKPIAQSPLVFIGPADPTLLWGSRGETPWQHLPMIISEEGLARERFNQWCREQGLTPDIHAEVKGNEAIVSMVSLGFGIGLVPRIVLDNSPLASRVKLLPDQPDLGPFETGICVLEKRLKSPIVAALWEQVVGS
ncbi:HTH-type transcriptional activator IlvY [Marinimicrobium sp. ABcell2]|uniref:HTH-type transcriptional activator IlvY n=1 Tax=Marinimicrobium sp. ABcell2 TaxID=3069751 RepID=UPI0027B80A46|nr:HTH-type transcriptional activator IlvY [Marinimicrobium sp. ABcell2]MDQ2078109.1 HTH-type transcriptional activator IlvY [Marinimicrobium sp. ABcell2]